MSARAGSLRIVPVDLHVHSTASDGSDSPAVLVAKAEAAGLTAIALTDHDTQAGVAAAREAAGSLELIPGVEISLGWTEGAMHLLVLFLEPGRGPLQDRLAELRKGRHHRNAAVMARLRDLGIEIGNAELAEEARGDSPGRPHLAAILVRKGIVPDIPTAFDTYLAKGRPAYVERPRLEPEEALALAVASGAVPVLAHPHTLGLDRAEELAELLIRLRAGGLIGLECHYGSYDPDYRLELAGVARRFDLIPSGGTDYHGTYKLDVELGVGGGDLRVGGEVLEELRAARPVIRS
jgi:predicted metal-dependent phosphoesterase TrpH